MPCVLSLMVSHMALERRHEKHSGKELVLLTRRQDKACRPLQQNTTTFQKEGCEELGVKEDNLCCQIYWSFHGQRQTVQSSLVGVISAIEVF